MALRVSDDDNLNPGQVDADRKFDVLKKAEENGTNSTGANSGYDADGLKQSEENPQSDNNWKTDVTGREPKTNSSTRFLGFIKKKGPISLIITVVLGGGIGLTTFFSPGILLVHIKEVMVEKFNTQLASMDVRTTKMLATKMGTTKGSCSVITIACKYSTMTDKQIANFEKAGITVETDGKSLIGRSKPKSFVFNGEKISAKDFSGKLSESTEFRSAIKSAYNPKFAGFADSFWKKAAIKLGISKGKISIDGDTDAKKLEDVQKKTKGGDTDVGDAGKKLKDGDKKPDGNRYTEEEIKANNEKLKTAGEFADNIDDVAKSGKKSSSNPAVFSGSKTVGGVVGIAGVVDSACMAYGSIQALGYAAKTIRTLQLASYAMIFLNVADQIKAGDAKAEDVSYLGTILTNNSFVDDKDAGKSATDSFGYKYAAYGDLNEMPESSMKYLAAGGLTGSLLGITSVINKTTKGTPKPICKVMGNPLVIYGGIALGVASLFFLPGVSWAKTAAQAAFTASLTIAVMAIPSMLQDIVAGVLVDETTIGSEAGDALVSGASGIMGTAAATGGNAPLTPEQAVAYSKLGSNIASQYAEEDRLAYSPLDITNSNTFLGSIVSSLIPYITKASSLSGVLGSVSTLVSSLVSNNIFANVKADDAEKEYTMCQDFDYGDLNGDGDDDDRIATDPFCNIIYGIPPESLDKDPLDVLKSMSSQIDSQTGEAVPGSSYEAFLQSCVDRDRPLGDIGSDGSQDDGSMCLFGQKIKGSNGTSVDNSDFYLYTIDQRVQKGMDGEDPVLLAAEESGLNGISFYDKVISNDNNVASVFEGLSSTAASIIDQQTSIETACFNSNLVGFDVGVKCDYNHLLFTRSRELKL